jgi:uncharacterized tellurite resistance protein B-like protein
MFKKIFDKKNENVSTNITKDITLVAALLVHAAKIDESYTNIEKDIIKKAIISLDATNTNQVEKILEKAEKRENESNQIVEFTREIKKYSNKFKLKIIEILWKIVYSDGTNDNYESNLIRRVCGLLYISDKVSGEIKIKVKSLLK